MRTAVLLLVGLGVGIVNLAGCAAASDSDPEEQASVESELTVPKDVSCTEKTEKAYDKGKPSTIKVIRIADKAISKTTGHAYLKMRDAAKKAGVTVALNSGFRTMAEQEYFYNCYLTKKCNSGNLAARPGYSNHQNGLAVDVSTSAWLAANAPKFGFVRTVPSEPWHWEFKGKDPGGPCTTPDEATPPPATPDAGKDAQPSAPEPATSTKDGSPAESEPKSADTGDNDDEDPEEESEPASKSSAPDLPAPQEAASCNATPGVTAPSGGLALGLAFALALSRRRRRS